MKVVKDSDGEKIHPEDNDGVENYFPSRMEDAEECDNEELEKKKTEEESMDRLERYGEWLLSIPRDDVLALQRQQSKAYINFCLAFEELRTAHEECKQRMETKKNSIFLLDDVILRIFEFLNCQSLIQTSMTCHRYHTLAYSYARQQQKQHHSNNPMMSLRAKEQSRGIDPHIPPFVPIPMSGLPKRVYVHNASDPDFNGIYFCTGTNGNGFFFTKPRHSTFPNNHHNNTLPSPPTLLHNSTATVSATRATHHAPPNQHQYHQPPQPNHNNYNNAHPHHHLQHQFALQNGFQQHHHFQMQQHDNNNIGPMNIPFPGYEENNADHLQLHNNPVHQNNSNNANQYQWQQQQEQSSSSDYPSSFLKCIIAKRFSNETLLWYMSKEVFDNEGQITQVFSFWARLMYIGDAESDLCRYPSMTSVLSRNGGPGWQPLSTTRAMTPPIVELLDP